MALLFLLLTGLPALPGCSGSLTAMAQAAADTVQTNTISCGQTLAGNISAVAQQDTYTFSANAGEAVVIAAVATSGTLVARLDLNTPSNVPIGNNGFGNTSTGSLTLPVTGVYTILVRDLSLNKTGAYAISLQFTTGRCAAEISCGETKTGNTINTVSQQDTWKFSAVAGEAVVIAAVASSGTLTARLDLYGPSNTAIGNNGFGNTGTGSLVLPTTGVYTILIRDLSLNKTGAYALNLQFTTGRCGASITGGQTLSGNIGDVAEQDSFIFFGQQGGSINVAAVATSGTLTARADVYRSSGAAIGNNGFGNTSTGNITLPVTGIYTILVRDLNLTKTGNYNINLTCLGNACPAAATLALTPAAQTITTGAKGSLTVTISPAQSTETIVSLGSTNPAVATVVASVTIAANATSTSFEVTGVAAGTATIIALLPSTLGGGANAAVTVALPCLPNNLLPDGFLPFSQVSYISGSSGAGDRLVVGKMPLAQLSQVPLPGQAEQRFCNPVQLAANLFAIAYVPAAAERSGDFSAFADQLRDPVNGALFPNGVIPANRLGDPHAWRIVSLIGAPATVSAASYSELSQSRESIVAAFGTRLATETRVATETPLPFELAGTTVKVIDNESVSRAARLFFVSPNQVNFQIPPDTKNGAATVVITSGNGTISIGTAQITTIAPGLFAGNSDGQGVAAAVTLRQKADGTQIYEPLMRFDQGQGKFVPLPIDLGPESEQVFLVLFGTGFRFRSAQEAVKCTIGGTDAEVIYAGEQGGFVGLDQSNVRLPRSLAGRGEVDVVLTVDGRVTNTVRIAFK